MLIENIATRPNGHTPKYDWDFHIVHQIGQYLDQLSTNIKTDADWDSDNIHSTYKIHVSDMNPGYICQSIRTNFIV